jgi:uncharacterized membrane protein YadS
MDCASVGRNRYGQEEQGAHPLALVHPVLLSGGSGQYLRTHIPDAFYPSLKHLGVIGLTVTLFLIGTGLSKKTLQEVGVRPLLQGVLLWIVVAVGSLALIRAGWIHL